jgi:hypothetical protein
MITLDMDEDADATVRRSRSPELRAASTTTVPTAPPASPPSATSEATSATTSMGADADEASEATTTPDATPASTAKSAGADGASGAVDDGNAGGAFGAGVVDAGATAASPPPVCKADSMVQSISQNVSIVKETNEEQTNKEINI